MLTTYADFFRPRGIKRFVGIGFLARMPMGTLGIATLLHVRELTGSIAFAGSVMGAQLMASAIMAPIWGRVIDAKGPHNVLRITGTVPALSLLLLFLARPLQLSHAAILVCAVITGAFMPPVPTIVRTIWRHRFDDERERQTAFALDSVLIELAFTLGPALVALLVAVASPRAAFGMAWLFVVASVPFLYASGGLGWWKAASAAERHLLGPLRERELLVLYASMFFLTVGFGGLEVAYLGFATERSVAAWGPTLIAINSVGSAIGGLLYGGLHVSMPVERLLPRLMSLLAIPIGLHMFVGSAWAMAPLAFVAGLFIAPSLTGATLLISRHAPPQYVTEAFTWSATAIVTGIGAGMAMGGALIEHWDARAAFALAMTSMLAGALFTLALRRGHLQIQPEERR